MAGYIEPDSFEPYDDQIAGKNRARGPSLDPIQTGLLVSAWPESPQSHCFRWAKDYIMVLFLDDRYFWLPYNTEPSSSSTHSARMSTNVVVNPSFESGLAPWTASAPNVAKIYNGTSFYGSPVDGNYFV